MVEGDGASFRRASTSTAYRIVQEALTNVLKHAGKARATVRVRFGERDLDLEISDDGRVRGRDPRCAGRRPGSGRDAGAGPAPRRPAPGRTSNGGRLPGEGAPADRSTGRGRIGGAAGPRYSIPRRSSAVIRVLIVDDQPLLRTGFRMILSAEPDLEVVGEAADGGRASTLARRLRPDVVLMDIRMPIMDGVAATRQLAGPGVDEPSRS